jgi:hypothetical protein
MAQMPKTPPQFSIKDYVLCREQEISRYMAEFDLPEYLADEVYAYECWIADLADSACENGF